MQRKRGRDSTNGRFIPLEEAKRRPRETIVETVKKPCPEKPERKERARRREPDSDRVLCCTSTRLV